MSEIVFDERFQFSAPIGSISHTGMEVIQRFITGQYLGSDEWKALNPAPKYYYLPRLPESWEWDWQIQSGDFRGNFGKRVRSYYHKVHDMKCPDSFIAAVGNLARQHSESRTVYEMDFTRDLQWTPGDFNDNSCYGYEQRNILMEHRAFAIRFYEGNEGFGRAWIYEVEPNLYVLFNGYGFETFEIARVFATYLNLPYKRIVLLNNYSWSGLIYINESGHGYAIGTKEQLERFDRFDLEFDDFLAECDRCGRTIDHEDDQYYAPNGDTYCYDCYHEYCDYCQDCGNDFWDDDMTYVESVDHSVCPSCLRRKYHECDRCNDYFPNGQITRLGEFHYCPNCLAELNAEGDNIE